MGDIRTTANAAFRDYVTDGVPGSGVHEPVKADVRASFGVVEDTVDAALADIAAAILSGGNIYADTTAGLAAVTEGQYFFVPVTDGLELFKDVAGVATSQGVVPSQTSLDANETAVNAAADRVPGVFIGSATDEYIKTLVTGLKVEGGEGDTYFLNYETIFFPGIPLYRIKFNLHSVATGATVAVWSKQGATDPTVGLADTAFLTLVVNGSVQAGYVGITATLTIDWSSILWTKNLTTYTTVAEAGVHSDNIVSNDLMDGFYALANPKRRITVGAAGDYTTVAAAVQSLYLPNGGATITRSTYPISDTCTFSEQVLIEVIDDAHDEEIASTLVSSIYQSTVVVPHYLTLRMRPDTVLWMNAAPGDTAPVLEIPLPCRIEGGTIWQQGEGYCLHLDATNTLTKRATAGDPVQRHKHRTVLKDVTLKSASTLTNGSIIGQGQSDGSGLVLDGVRMVRTGVGAAPLHLCHTSPSSLDPGFIYYRNVIGEGQPAGVADLQVLKSHAQTVRHRLFVENCDITEIEAAYTGGLVAPHAFVRASRFDGFTYPADLDPS